jgi:cytochrome c553
VLPVLAQSPERLALCATCHGSQGVSSIPQIPSLAGQPKTFLENQMVLIREGLRDIPMMKGVLDGLKDNDLIVLANYFQSLPPPVAASGPVNEERYQRGKSLAHNALCGTCHLPDYGGRQQIPRLAGQQEVFLLDAMKQFRDHAGPGRDTIMSASLYGINDEQLTDLAHFFSHLK